MVLQLKDIVKQYKKVVVLNGINLEFKENEIVALVGKNGAGKTTLMKIITSLSKSTKGDLIWSKGFYENKYRVGSMISSPDFFNNLTGYENIEYFRILKQIEDKSIVDDVLKKVDLYNDRNKKFSKYSLGMKQRLAVALCLLDKPKMLVLDEPTNGIDPEGIIEINRILNELNNLYGVAILISSHSLMELTEIADRFIFIHQGIIKKDISRENMFIEMNDRTINEYFSDIIRSK